MKRVLKTANFKKMLVLLGLAFSHKVFANPVVDIMYLELQQQTLNLPNGPLSYFKNSIIEILATHGPAPIDSNAAAMQLFGVQSLKTNDRFFLLLIGKYDEHGHRVGFTPYYLVPETYYKDSSRPTYGILPEHGHFPEVRANANHPSKMNGERMNWAPLETDSFMMFQGDKFIFHDGEIFNMASDDRVMKRLVQPGEVMELQHIFFDLRRWTFAFHNDGQLHMVHELVPWAEALRLSMAQSIAGGTPEGDGSAPDCKTYLH